MYTKQERMMDEPILYKAYYTMAMEMLQTERTKERAPGG